MKLIKRIAGILLVFGTIQQVHAQEDGLTIARKSYNLDAGFENYSVHVKMILVNGRGKEIQRNLIMKTLEVENDGNKTLMKFLDPEDVKGTAILTFTHRHKEDDQWLYLPALGRVKRISSSSKSGAFLGSEFAFEDLASPEIEKYDYRFNGTSTINSTEVMVVERIPVDKNSGYSKQEVHYNAENYKVEQVDFYDRKGLHVKTLSFEDYRIHSERFWKPGRMLMQNHKNGKMSSLEFQDYTFNDDSIRETEFSSTGLMQ